MIHSNGPDGCLSCNSKLQFCHIDIQHMFAFIRVNFPDAHIAWGFRDERNQTADFMAGRSKLDWPNSKHNFTLDGRPCSKAIDLFRLDEYGKAEWNVGWYESIWNILKTTGLSITWGGTFKHFKDSDHFEIT